MTDRTRAKLVIASLLVTVAYSIVLVFSTSVATAIALGYIAVLLTLFALVWLNGHHHP